jgi:uncharacterized protein YjbJ (UPF0337 family)
MNWNMAEKNWSQFRGKVKSNWNKLTDNQLDMISGKRDQLMSKIQEAYTLTRDAAEEQVRKFESVHTEAAPKPGEVIGHQPVDPNKSEKLGTMKS